MICPNKGCAGRTRCNQTRDGDGPETVRRLYCPACGLTFTTRERPAYKGWVEGIESDADDTACDSIGN